MSHKPPSIKHSNPDEQSDIRFATLGVVVLDELHFPSQKPLINVIGGSGAFSKIPQCSTFIAFDGLYRKNDETYSGTLGARIFSPSGKSKCIGWVIRAGHDFPPSTRADLEFWHTRLLILDEEDSQSTRGCLEYEDSYGDNKTFNYLTPVLKILPCHFKESTILDSHSFHFLADPHEITEQVPELLLLRQDAGISNRPLVLWEPRPSSCIPANMNAVREAVREVDVFSPNHVELFAVYGLSIPIPFDVSAVEELALPFITSGIGPAGKGSVAIRAGEHGCLIASATQAPTWFPAYYKSSKNTHTAVTDRSGKVIDPTGAGNAFLGAFAIGFLDTHSICDAACYGTVGASFAVEQIGVPELSVVDDEELWNKERAFSRLVEYKSRLE